MGAVGAPGAEVPGPRRDAVLPELFIIGGGVSRKAHKFLPHIEGIKAEIVPAGLQNNAGIVGAAMRAAERTEATG